jgi:hypothetical protein
VLGGGLRWRRWASPQLGLLTDSPAAAQVWKWEPAIRSRYLTMTERLRSEGESAGAGRAQGEATNP